MKILTAKRFYDLLCKNPGKRFAFYEMGENGPLDILQITDGYSKMPWFGATELTVSYCYDNPNDDYEKGDNPFFNYDWNVTEDLSVKYCVLENMDVVYLKELVDSIYTKYPARKGPEYEQTEK